MATEVQKRPINRLQTVYALRALMDKNYEATLEAQREGRPIAWCMAEGFAGPLLNVMDIEAVFPENYATHCAAVDAASLYIDRATAEGFPTHLCTYAQTGLGYASMMQELGEIPPGAPQGGLPKPILMVGSAPSCDARSKWFQAMQRYIDAPLWITQSPATGARESLMEGAYERDVQFTVEDLRRFIAFLENLVGKKFDYDRLAEEEESRTEMEAIWYEITDEMRQARPCPMNSRDHYSAMSPTLFNTRDVKAVVELYKKMRDEVQQRIDDGIAGINRPEKYRVSFHGLGPWHSMNLFDKIAERGWNSVWEDYHPQAPVDLSGVSDPLERLVRRRRRSTEWYINHEFPPGQAAEVTREIMETGTSDKLTVQDARKHQMDGVILHTAISCRMTSIGTGLRQLRLMEIWNVPCLLIEGDMIDRRLFSMDEFMTKCEAFEDTMDHYKQVRKERGLEW